MQGKPKRQRQKRCKSCGELFQPDARSKGKQRYCSKAECQRKRQRQNEKDWRRRNPECVEYQYQQTRQWNKAHPDYSRQRRAKNPKILEQNRSQTLIRMRKSRMAAVFDKSKVILTQLVGSKGDKCYLTHGGKGLYVCLTKASPLSRRGSVRDNRSRFKRVANRLPRGRLYDLSGILG
jgi:hypothetical protein